MLLVHLLIYDPLTASTQFYLHITTQSIVIIPSRSFNSFASTAIYSQLLDDSNRSFLIQLQPLLITNPKSKNFDFTDINRLSTSTISVFYHCDSVTAIHNISIVLDLLDGSTSSHSRKTPDNRLS